MAVCMFDNSLSIRNVNVDGRRTSMKLEPDMWLALDEICWREKMTVHDVCTQIAQRRLGANLTAAVRVYILSYFRAAATEDGHLQAGHGALPTRLNRGNSARAAGMAANTEVVA